MRGLGIQGLGTQGWEEQGQSMVQMTPQRCETDSGQRSHGSRDVLPGVLDPYRVRGRTVLSALNYLFTY